MRKTFQASLVGLSLAAAPAMAQEASGPVNDPAPTTTTGAGTIQEDQPYVDPSLDPRPFTGFYIGGSLGYAIQNNDVGTGLAFDRGGDGSFGETVTTSTGADAFSTGFCNGAATSALSPANGGRCRNDKDAIEYYGRVGFDAQFGRIVLGLVGEFGKPEIDDSASAFSTTPANYVMTRSVEWEASVRARVGYAAGRSTLFYSTAGPAYARIDNDFRSTNTANAFSFTDKDTVLGFVAGGGIEQMIGSNISFGVEYMYHRYRDDDARVQVRQGSAPATNPFVLANGVDFRRTDVRFPWHSLRGTLNFRF